MAFLTDEQAEAYAAFRGEPTRPELERFFFLPRTSMRPRYARRTGTRSMKTVSGADGSGRFSTAGRGRTRRGRWHCSLMR